MQKAHFCWLHAWDVCSLYIWGLSISGLLSLLWFLHRGYEEYLTNEKDDWSIVIFATRENEWRNTQLDSNEHQSETKNNNNSHHLAIVNRTSYRNCCPAKFPQACLCPQSHESEMRVNVKPIVIITGCCRPSILFFLSFFLFAILPFLFWKAQSRVLFNQNN